MQLIIRQINATFYPMEVKTMDGKIHRIEPHEVFNTTILNPITHSRNILTGKERFKAIDLNKIYKY